MKLFSFMKSRKQRFADFAMSACEVQQTTTIKIREAYPLMLAIEKALLHKHPDLDSHFARRLASEGVVLTCPTCGEYNDQARDIVLLAGVGGAFEQAAGVTFGGPIAASLGQGHCPGCNGTRVRVTFDSSQIDM